MVWDWVSCAALKHSDVPSAENGGQRTLMVQSFCPRVATSRHVLHALIAEFAAVMALALLVYGWILVSSDGGAEGKCHRTRVAAWCIAVATEHHCRTWAGSVPGWDQSAFAAKVQGAAITLQAVRIACRLVMHLTDNAAIVRLVGSCSTCLRARCCHHGLAR